MKLDEIARAAIAYDTGNLSLGEALDIIRDALDGSDLRDQIRRNRAACREYYHRKKAEREVPA